MSLSSTTRKQSFTSNQVTAAFDFLFPALPGALSDIKCAVLTSGTTNLLTYLTDYTVTINAAGDGGTVTLLDPTAVSKGTLTIYRETTNLQESDYEDFNQFPADTLERDLDRRTMVAQELSEEIARAVRVPITATVSDLEIPQPEAGRALIWNAAADAIVNSDTNITAFETDLAAAVALADTYAANADSHATTSLGHSNTSASHATTSLGHSNTSDSHATTSLGHSNTSASHATTAGVQASASASSATTSQSHATTALTVLGQYYYKGKFFATMTIPATSSTTSIIALITQKNFSVANTSSTILIPIAGFYNVAINTQWQASAASYRRIEINKTIAGGSNGFIADGNNGGYGVHTVSFSFNDFFNANEQLSFYTEHGITGDLIIYDSSSISLFRIAD